MIDLKIKQWIDDASYEELLRKWRFALAGDPYFVGEMGVYYSNIMAQKRMNVDHVAASKRIGWEK